MLRRRICIPILIQSEMLDKGIGKMIVEIPVGLQQAKYSLGRFYFQYGF